MQVYRLSIVKTFRADKAFALNGFNSIYGLDI